MPAVEVSVRSDAEGNPGHYGLYSMRVAQPEAAAAGLALGR